MIYCWVRDEYIEQNECCTLCKDYDEKTDSCKVKEEKSA
jgi:hypothetical protein